MILELAAMLNAVGVLLVGIATIRVHREVRTGNGQTMARLADLAEGRRISRDVPLEQRSPADQHYVDQVSAADDIREVARRRHARDVADPPITGVESDP